MREARSPASSISRKRRCRSIASGVVCDGGAPLAADDAARRCRAARASGPAASRIEWSRNAVVVFPFVPVTPATVELVASGSPKNASAATRHRRPRVLDDELRHGERRAGARRRARPHRPRRPRPRSRARPARAPGTQKKSVPAATRRASYARSRISTGRRARSPRSARARAISASSSTGAPFYGGGAVPAAYGVLDARRSRLAVAGFDSGASGGTSRYWSAKRAISRNAGAATMPPQIAPLRLVDRSRGSTSRGFVRRHEADERGDVASSRVAARSRASAPCRSCRRPCSPGIAASVPVPLGDDVAEHRHHLRRRRARR